MALWCRRRSYRWLAAGAMRGLRLTRVRGVPRAGEALGFNERSLGSVDPNKPIRSDRLIWPFSRTTYRLPSSLAYRVHPSTRTAVSRGGTVVIEHNDRVRPPAAVNEPESVGDRRLTGKLIKHTRPATRQVAVRVRRFVFRRGRIRNRRSGLAHGLQCLFHLVRHSGGYQLLTQALIPFVGAREKPAKQDEKENNSRKNFIDDTPPAWDLL